MFRQLLAEDPAGHHTEELVHRAKGGDATAYNALFKRLEGRLLVYIRYRLGVELRESLDEVDVLQEAYLQAHRSFSNYQSRDSGAFCAWIYRIVDHRIQDAVKHVKAAKRRPKKGFARGSDVFNRVRSNSTSPSQACVRGEDTEFLLAALDDLPVEEAEVILFRYFQEQSAAMIAERLGRSEVSVRRLLARARLRLGKSIRRQRGGSLGEG
ncbi:MAG: sigma-70 family RNA polymerase sigma factor [Planctomycetota bacterium]|nr:sigma-70 family RNA polymerase sigma factor [Planctomycetota bacterium]